MQGDRNIGEGMVVKDAHHTDSREGKSLEDVLRYNDEYSEPQTITLDMVRVAVSQIVEPFEKYDRFINQNGQEKMAMNSDSKNELYEHCIKAFLSETQHGDGFFQVDASRRQEIKEYLQGKPQTYPNAAYFEATATKYAAFFDRDIRFDREFDPRSFIKLLADVDSKGTARRLYQEPLTLRKQEPDTLATHTASVLGRFEKYFAPRWRQGELAGVETVLDVGQMRMLLTIHDFGKPLEKDSSRQTSVIVPLATELLGKIYPDTDDARRILLVHQIETGPLHMHVAGKYGDASKTSRQVAQEISGQIRENAKTLGVDPQALARVAEVYLQCDAGAYPSMEHFFPKEFDHEKGFHTMSFDETRMQAHTLLLDTVTLHVP
jgi:hypothetical protein